jgi:hypothetical protein
MRNEKGISLLEVVMGLALAGGLALFIASITKQGLQGSNAATESLDMNELGGQLSTFLSKSDVCEANFKDKLANSSIDKIVRSTEASAAPMVENGKQFGKITVDNMAIKYLGSGVGELSYDVNRGSVSVGRKKISKKMALAMTIAGKTPGNNAPSLADFDPSKDTIESCHAVAGAGGGLSVEEVEQLIEAATPKYGYCMHTLSTCPTTMTDIGMASVLLSGAPEVVCSAHFSKDDTSSSALYKYQAMDSCLRSYESAVIVIKCELSNMSGDSSVGLHFRQASDACYKASSKTVNKASGVGVPNVRICCI